MKTKLILLVSIMSFSTNISGLFAGEWVKKTVSNACSNNSKSAITDENTTESSNEGLYAKYWADGNDIGFSMTGWLLTQDKKRPSINEIKGNLFDGSITHEFQWSQRNPPKTAFSCDWTEVLYVQSRGNCDNGALFNNKGLAKVRTKFEFNFASGPYHTMDNYQVHYDISAGNRENKVKRSPEVEVLGKGKEYDLIGQNWDDKPDKKKSWSASGGDIVSFSVGMDNTTSDNIFSRGAIGSGINLELQDKAKSSLAGIFQELSGFDLVMDGAISSTQVYHPISYSMINFTILRQIRQIWEKAALKVGLSLDVSRKVYDFLDHRPITGNSQSLDENLLARSINRYLEQFAYAFQGQRSEQACYYMAWLIAEAAARPAATSEDNTNIKVSFDNLIDKLTRVLNKNARQAIADFDSPEIQKELNENLTRVKGRLLYYFYELHDDPLFPAFKRPIDNQGEAIIIQKFENEKILFNLLNSQIKTRPVSEFYKKWLSFYFDRVADRVVFWLAVETNKDEFRNLQYWGGMNFTSRSCRSGLWPVEIYLTPIESR
jgi:hypothetical protein